MANVKFVVEGAPATPAEGTTDGEGRVSLLVPAYVAELTLPGPGRRRNEAQQIVDRARSSPPGPFRGGAHIR